MGSRDAAIAREMGGKDYCEHFRSCWGTPCDMVLHEDGGEGVVCVGQASHAWICGQLARAWGNDLFVAPDPFEDVCLGAEQHDIGMAEWDIEPAFDPATGLPVQYFDIPRATHMSLWQDAARKVLTQSPYAALLVSMHGHALYSRYGAGDADPDLVRRYLAAQEALQADLMERLGEDPERARRNQRLVWAWDFASLALLHGWTGKSVPAPTRAGAPDTELRVRGNAVGGCELGPWPFRGERIEVRCQGRRLAARCADADELHAALAAAPWVTVRFELTAPPQA
jgi:hypothetical protein